MSVKYWNKLEQNNFNNMIAMKINVIFKFHSSPADTKLESRHQDTFRFDQKFQSKWLTGYLVVQT